MGRALALRQELALDPVGVRVPALPQEQFGLPLSHHVPSRQADRGKSPAPPDAGWDAGFVLCVAQRLARAAVAVADHHTAEEIAHPVTRAQLRFADHRPMEHRSDLRESVIRGASRQAGDPHRISTGTARQADLMNARYES